MLENHVFLGLDCLIPELLSLGWERYRSAHRDVVFSHNENCYKISYIAKGPVQWWAVGEPLTLPSGSLYITSPFEKHGALNEVMPSCELYWLQVDFSRVPIPESSPDRFWACDETLLSRIKHQLIKGNEETRRLFSTLLRECRFPRESSFLLMRATLTALLIHIYRLETSSPSHALSKVVQPILDFIEKHLPASPSLDELASHGGISRSYLHQLFVEHIGESPGAYMMRRRIAMAQERLHSSDLSITTIAYDLGFSSSQHLSSSFKKVTGFTPRAWRNKFID